MNKKKPRQMCAASAAQDAAMAKERTLVERIILARGKLGLSQTQAAKAWGFSKSAMQAWEQEVRNPAGLYKKRLLQVLKRIEGKD